MDGHHPKAIDNRPPIVGDGFASTGRRPMDLQEIPQH